MDFQPVSFAVVYSEFLQNISSKRPCATYVYRENALQFSLQHPFWYVCRATAVDLLPCKYASEEVSYTLTTELWYKLRVGQIQVQITRLQCFGAEKGWVFTP